MPDAIFILDISADGVVATHPARTEMPNQVAPIAEADKNKKFNTLRPHLIAIACMSLPGTPNFEFDSSVLSPSAENQFRKFAQLMLALQKQDTQDPKRFAPCSIFGHADPTGKDDYNRVLSGRRSLAVYGVLTHNVKIWDALFNNTQNTGDKWGIKSIQKMLSIPLRNEKGDPKAPPSPPFYTGPIDDKKTPETTAAIKAYQEDRGILNPGNGFPGEQTRARLFSEYMNAICHDNQGNPFKIAPTDFIARNQDTARQVAGLVPGLRGDVQGCGEFNPVLLLSEKQEEDFKPEEQHKARDEAYAADRRVIVYVFRHGTEIDFNRWPCPLATSRDTVPCTKRFWSDGDDRRGFRHPFRERHWRITGVDEDPDHPFDPDTPDPPDPNDPDKKQRPIEQRDTMACRFYHAFAFQSPCEAGSRLWIVRFLVDGFNNKQVPLSRRRYVLKAGQTDFAPVIRGTLDASGEVRIPVLDEVALMTIKLDVFGKEVPDDDQQSGGGGATKGPVSAKSSSSAPAPQKTADAPKTEAAGDTDRFPDEDRFLTFELDAGALKPMSVEPGTGNRVVAQRLYNLGFGDHAPQDWDNDEFTRAVRDYRRTRNLGDDAKLDRQTRLNIKVDHELGGAPPPDDD